jgi:hypothetical protein
MATLRARRSSRTSRAIRLTMIAVSVIFGEIRPKTYVVRVSAVVPGCQSKVRVWPIGFFDRGHGQKISVARSDCSFRIGPDSCNESQKVGNRPSLGPSVISYYMGRGSILGFVDALPQLNPDGRAPRFNLADITPAVLRFEDGRRTQAQLETISLTGGMLYVPTTVLPDSQVKLMFVTPTGPVLATAEMLKPISLSQQPFRFVALDQDDRRRLHNSIQSSFVQPVNEQEWIEKYRAAVDQCKPEKRWFSTSVAVFTIALLSLGSAIYLFGMFNLHLK